ncbi:hypothetical protein GYMLUDRAFT_628401 [Collybiopsis luxurians FD-317 M1]|nr:hypothetical protein GYMLUDRAFT_628401 [Collybiopsis luxurians FD-317 M1]
MKRYYSIILASIFPSTLLFLFAAGLDTRRYVFVLFYPGLRASYFLRVMTMMAFSFSIAPASKVFQILFLCCAIICSPSYLSSTAVISVCLCNLYLEWAVSVLFVMMLNLSIDELCRACVGSQLANSAIDVTFDTEVFVISPCTPRKCLGKPAFTMFLFVPRWSIFQSQYMALYLSVALYDFHFSEGGEN